MGAGPAGIAAAVHAAERGPTACCCSTRRRAPAARSGATGAASARRAALARAARAIRGRRPRRGRGRRRPGARRPARRAARPPAARELRRPRRCATGARELLLPFPGWTTPGVIGAGAAQALRESGARFAGLRVVVAGSGPLLVAVAAALRKAGARVVGLAEQAPWARLAAFAAGLARSPHRLVQAAGHLTALAGVPYRTGAWVREAVGRERLERVVVCDGRREWSLGLRRARVRLRPRAEPRAAAAARLRDRLRRHGARRVTADERPRCLRGRRAGRDRRRRARPRQRRDRGPRGGRPSACPERSFAGAGATRRFAARLSRAFALREELRTLARPDTVVCRCEDVPLLRIRDAAAIEPAARCVKLHSRAGMGPCQGRVCGAALGFLFGWSADTIRPPLLPAPLALLAESGGDAPAAGSVLASQEEGR